ncbi:MFS transporter [Ferribacterium limneticum]|uniref:MFS transporter n=1 Tax=Ferribacterium limneticum TaxID=76259 RepID=UPI001CF8F304|nr:MFS transporter [Ferribacterium limneticum]UCV26833.1 MFS transporter [Ferribacterium limneticum]UCV30750.1 MFS transporter [Ferribacterium limneticum]
MTTATLPAPQRSDIEVISVIGFVHGVSHFFHLLLPPLFPWLMPEFGLSFTAIGTTMTVFFVVSGIGQASAGFLVDRFGAARVLGGGIACFALAGVLLYFANGYPMLIAVAALAGLGNSVFHPADFTVLNRHVSQARLGHAFSAHGLSGNLGWAAAPIFLTGLATAYGWRTAALGASAMAIAALALLFWRRDALTDPVEHHTEKASEPAGTTFAFLSSRAVWLCFLFFLLITAAFGTIQNFASPILQALYGLSITTAAFALSTYLVGGAVGIILGGFLAQKGEHDHLIAGALGVAALLAILLAAGVMPSWSILPLMAGIGFCTGTAGPSRDLLVRRAATARFGKAAYGRVYGFVYSGLDLGLAMAPVIFGGLMDARHFSEVLVGIAILQVLAIFSALRVGKAI